MTSGLPGLDLEAEFLASGFSRVAGLDEAGRGAWAGPVCAGAVILPLGDRDAIASLQGVRDSKLCTSSCRERLRELILRHALASATGWASAAEIDELGIVPATRLAMRRAVDSLNPLPQALLIDGRNMSLRDLSLPQRAMNRGELLSLSIAAASILAKVARDQHLAELDSRFPHFGFARNKGYGTSFHREALERLGPSTEHRQTFEPVRQRLVEAS